MLFVTEYSAHLKLFANVPSHLRVYEYESDAL